MKYFLNVFLAFAWTWILLSLAAEYVHHEGVSSKIFSVSFHMYVILWWVVFSFPQYVGRTASQVGHWIYELTAYGLQTVHHLLTHLWKYRIGQVAIGGLTVYIMYHFFY